MCTSINYVNGDHYFGRNLDLEVDFPVDVVITPENYEFKFRHIDNIKSHNALIGMSLVEDDYPMYFEAINNKGLGMAGLAFAALAKYYPPQEGKTNLASYEFIPYILGTCSTVKEAKEKLKNINITTDSFSEQYHYSPLHWQIGDKDECIVVESTEKGLEVFDNPFGVLTNCPGFEYQKTNLSNYVNLTVKKPDIRFSEHLEDDFTEFSAGMGSIGLPGGVDSVSRFVRVAFAKLNSKCEADNMKNVAQYLHLLGVVQQSAGEDEIKPGLYEVTQYSAFGNTTQGIWYFTTYFNPNVYSVDMNKEDLQSTDLIIYPVPKELKVECIN